MIPRVRQVIIGIARGTLNTQGMVLFMNSQIKLYIGLVLVLLIVVFTVQNAGAVTVSLFFWEFSISLALMIFIILVVGFLMGWTATSWSRHARQSLRQDKTP